MKNKLKEILNFKTVLKCYVSAIGYGFGYNLPNKLGCSMLVSIICCLCLGSIFDFVANIILSTDYFNKSKKNRIIVGTIIYVSYLIVWLLVDGFLQYDLDNDFFTNLGFVIVIQIILIIKDLVINIINEKKLKNKNNTNL